MLIPIKLYLIIFIQTFVVDGANMIFFSPLYSGSHSYHLGRLADEMVKERGHKVTQVTFANTAAKVIPGRHNKIELFIDNSKGQCGSLVDPNGRVDLEAISKLLGSNGGSMFFILDFLDVSKCACEALLNDEKLQDLMDNSNDLALVDSYMADCALGLARAHSLPVVTLFGLANRYTLNTPSFHSPASHPKFMSGLSGPLMTMSERAWNMVTNLATSIVMALFLRDLEQLFQSKFPGLPTLAQMHYSEVEFYFTNSNNFVDEARLDAPNFRHHGGWHITRKPERFKPELEQFVNESENDFIIFSTGMTGNQNETLPPEVLDAFLEAFACINTNVILKGDTNVIPNPPKNVKVLRWVPQESLLVHPKVGLFVTHAGIFSFLESLHHGVPMLALPLFLDQIENAKRIERKGYGRALGTRGLDAYGQAPNSTYLKELIVEVLDNPKYLHKIREASSIWKEMVPDPRALLISDLELVAKYKNLDHFKIQDGHLNVCQYFCLDIIFAYIFAPLLIFALTLKWTMKREIRQQTSG